MSRKLSEPMLEILVALYQSKGDWSPSTSGSNRWRTVKSLVDKGYIFHGEETQRFDLTYIGIVEAEKEIKERQLSNARINQALENSQSASAIMERIMRELRRLKNCEIGGQAGLEALENLTYAILNEKRLVDSIRLAQWSAKHDKKEKTEREESSDEIQTTFYHLMDDKGINDD